ncbi:MAG: TrkH family potassium uptake protein [Bacillota bacterium]
MPVRERRLFSSRFSPPKVLVAGFAAVILAGAVLLCLPFASASGQAGDFLTALFTATSAVCVTGLVVVDTGTHWSFWGQLIILILIQTGGLGFMTMATLFFLLLGKRIGLKERILIRESLNQIDVAGVVRLVRAVLLFTFATEGIFAFILSWRWFYDVGWPRCLWFGLFHAVSAFNNAGFDVFGGFRSLTAYAGDPVVVFSVTTLIILGGLGFSVVVNIYKWKERGLSVHSRLTLLMTVFLIGCGFLFFLFLEWSHGLTHLSLPGKFLAAYFQSVTPRTAGFNTVDIGGLRPATQFLLIIFMFIGASPGSTGGGIKTTTFGLLVIAVWSLARGKEDTELMRRRILPGQVYRALAVALLAVSVVTVATLVLNITEKADFLTILFESVSAFGTVGLSMGLTPHLTPLGRILIILTMFSGRLGPLTLVFALAQQKKKTFIRYPEEKILIG